MIAVVAVIRLNRGRRNEFLKILHDNVPKVEAEDGCIMYQPCVDLDSGLEAQQPQQEDEVVIMEQWRNLDALHAHLQASHMESYRQRVADLVDHVTLRVMGPSKVD
jgi:quinol monooxygenase YgiN